MKPGEDLLKTAILDSAIAARDALEVLIAEKTVARDALQEQIMVCCPHEKVVEGDYVPRDYSDSSPCFRVCTVCGYAEEGWGAGYWKLQHSSANVTADTARRYVRKFVRQEDMRALGRYGGAQCVVQ